MLYYVFYYIRLVKPDDVWFPQLLYAYGRAKYVEEINVDKSYDEIEAEIKNEVAELIRKGADEL